MPLFARILVAVWLIAWAIHPAFGESFPVPVGLESLREKVSASPSGSILLFSPNDLLPALFLPLHGEGKIRTLTVVVPSEKSFKEEDLVSWKTYVNAFSPGSGNGFALQDGAMTGEIEGLEVRVFPLKAWRDPPKEGPVILDVAFLLAMFRDEIRTPVADLPRTFLAMLDERKIDAARLLPWVADRRDVPLERGYLPRIVAELANDPAAFRGSLPAKWQALQTGEHLAYLGMYEQALAHLEGFLKEEPEEPSVLFRIAFTYFVDEDVERGLRFLYRAYRADSHYIRGYSASGFTLYRKGELESAERVVRAGLHLEPDFLDLKMGLARIVQGQAKKLLPGNAAAAEERFSEIRSLGLPKDLFDQLTSEWEQSKAEGSPSGESPREGIPSGHPANR